MGMDEPVPLEEEEEEEPVREQWDCETILSTRSNLSNHPGKIEVKKLGARAPLKKIVEGDEDEASEDDEDEEEEEEVVELPELVLLRPKNETAEEKRLRKQAVKVHKRLCRQMKKKNKLLYRAEELKMKQRDVVKGDVRDKLTKVPL